MRKISIILVLNFFFLGFFSETTRAYFEDVDTTHPNIHAINFLEQNSIVKGYKIGDQKYFKPLQKINRSEALKVLMLAAEIEILDFDETVFDDVRMSDWFFRYVTAAAKKGIVKGFADGRFHPSAQVSRAEFLKMSIKAFDIPVEEQASEEEWFEPYMSTAEKFRLTPNITRSPHESISRAEGAEIIFRSLWCQNHDFEKKYVYSGSGKASFYNEGFAGNPTASGEIFDPTALTAAHRTLPFGTRLKVFNEAGDFVVVKINDRGPYHPDRVLDLSQRAFEKLAPISRGVIEISFEVFSDPEDERAVVPEQIRPSLSTEAKNERVPDLIAEKIQRHQREEDPVSAVVQNKRRVVKPIFDEMVKVLPENFFENATLHRTIPQKVLLGTVLGISGMADEWGHETVTFFLEDLKTGDQQHFSSAVSGKNFLVPVPLFQKGTFRLGLVFDDEQKSRIAEIEVVDQERNRFFPASDMTFKSLLDFNVVPENSQLRMKWVSAKNRLTKIVFSQGVNVQKTLVFEDGIEQFDVPYDFFSSFQVDQNLAVDMYQAQTLDGTQQKQNTNWKKVLFKNFILVEGFPDRESEKISIHKFPRFVSDLEGVTISGKILSQDVALADDAFFIFPDGSVHEFPILKNGDSFSVQIKLKEFGNYVFEIISDKGEILFNRGIYFSAEQVLPVFPRTQSFVRSNSKTGVLNWINALRRKNDEEKLNASAELDVIAQAYADQMVEHNFISHVDQRGNDFETRMKLNDMVGEYGENLSMGSTMKLALSGLENSASHRKNLLMQKWKRVGIGVAQNERDEYYVVQIFGK